MIFPPFPRSHRDQWRGHRDVPAHWALTLCLVLRYWHVVPVATPGGGEPYGNPPFTTDVKKHFYSRLLSAASFLFLESAISKLS